jgi:phosphoribosylformylglycinamidine cyclo-ligase
MLNYKQAGVDIDRGDELVQRLQKFCPDIGGFGGLFPLGDDYLVAGTDGVGTKLKLAFELNLHDTVGVDLVAMCVNDIITTGAKPLFFLDYFATDKLNVDQAELVLKGIIRGCQEAECVLLGGETAEMPGFYKPGEYDIAGFAVGIVKKKNLIDGKTIKHGDILIGIPSSGIHSNGFSLVREVLKRTNTVPTATLLTPTRIYVRELSDVLSRHKVKGIAHITGGGLIGNVPRMLPKGLKAQVRQGYWHVPTVFDWLEKAGKIDKEEMYRTFNMGIGMVLAMDPGDGYMLLKEKKEYVAIGQIVTGEGEFEWLEWK